MGFFNDVGRTVERVKQSVTDDPTRYRCTACGAVQGADHDHCPDCGEAAVVEIEPEGDGVSGAHEGDRGLEETDEAPDDVEG